MISNWKIYYFFKLNSINNYIKENIVIYNIVIKLLIPGMSWKFQSGSHLLMLVWDWPNSVPAGMSDPAEPVAAIFCPLTNAPNALLTVLPQIPHSIGYSKLAYMYWQVLRISNAASRLMLEPKFSKNFRRLSSSAENYCIWKRELTYAQTFNSSINSQISRLITNFLRLFDIFPE